MESWLGLWMLKIPLGVVLHNFRHAIFGQWQCMHGLNYFYICYAFSYEIVSLFPFYFLTAPLWLSNCSQTIFALQFPPLVDQLSFEVDTNNELNCTCRSYLLHPNYTNNSSNFAYYGNTHPLGGVRSKKLPRLTRPNWFDELQPHFCGNCRRENLLLDELFSKEIMNEREFENLSPDALLDQWSDKEKVIRMAQDVSERKKKFKLK